MNNIKNNSLQMITQEEIFPVDVFPLVVTNFTEVVSRSMVCPIDFPAIGVLAAVSIAIGSSSEIMVSTGWNEGANIIAVIIGEPGSKKTPSLTAALRPIVLIQEELGGEFKLWEANGKEGPMPEVHSILTTNATTEALGENLERNPNGMLLSKDELIGWLKGMNQYKGGNGEDTEFYLSIWSRSIIIIHRKGKQTIQINTPFLSIVGGIQNDLLPELTMKGNGLRDRILFSFPKPVPAAHSDHEISEEVSTAYIKLIISIYNIQKDSEPKRFAFTDEAKQLWKDWHTEFCNSMNEDGLPYYMLGVMSKLEAYTARFSLILEHLKCASEGTKVESIDRNSLEGAIKLTNYFKAHAAKVLDSLTSTNLEKKIESAIEWLKKRPYGMTSLRKFYTNGVAGIRNKQEADDFLTELCSRGLGSMERSDGKGTVTFRLNSKLMPNNNQTKK